MRSGSATALLADQTLRSATFPAESDPLHLSPEDDDLGRRATATDGGVRLAGGPPGDSTHTMQERRGEMFPPPYHRY